MVQELEAVSNGLRAPKRAPSEDVRSKASTGYRSQHTIVLLVCGTYGTCPQYAAQAEKSRAAKEEESVGIEPEDVYDRCFMKDLPFIRKIRKRA